MSPDNWRKLSAALDRLLELPRHEQVELLESLRRDDPEMCTEVESLLAQENSHGLFQTPPTSLLAELTPTSPGANPGALQADTDPLYGNADAAPIRQAGRYLIQEEIARGGMGAIFRAVDPEFDRLLAVKILLPQARVIPDAERRFLQEACITGRLQHPGIPPVHELGRLENGVPFFAMKLIAGKTLSELIQQDDFAKADPRWVGIFEQICRTLAYAHSQGIIHRDLKPSNVMVGAFGEVQVMDWGLAKTAAGVSEIGDDAAPPKGATSDDLSQVGSVIGTPAYLAPEQARGETDDLDERCDVFGLGGILCALMSGRPPFQAATAQDQIRKSALGELTQAFETLDRASADVELVAIAKKCLAADRNQRFRDASEVADAVTGYREGVQEKLRQAELEREKAQVQAAEERRRRRLTLTLAGVLLVLVLGAAAAGLWYQQFQTQRQARARNLNELVARSLTDAEAERRQLSDRLTDPDRVHVLLSDLQPWRTSLDTAKTHWRQARKIADSDPELLEPDLLDRLQSFEKTLADDDVDEAFARELDGIRLKWFEQPAEPEDASGLTGVVRPPPRDSDYIKLFVAKGWRVGEDSPEDLANRIRQSPTRYVASAALDDWAQTLLYRKPRNEALIKQLLDVSRRVDPEPWRDRFRRWEVWSNSARLQQTVNELDPRKQSPQILRTAAEVQRYHRQDALVLLRAALLHHPDDFWLNHRLGISAMDVSLDESLGAFRAALALRPRSHDTLNNFAAILLKKGDPAAAVDVLQQALKQHPGDTAARCNLALALHRTRRLDAAVEQYVHARALEPTDPIIHNNLAIALRDQGKFAEAVDSLRTALKLKHRENGVHLLRSYETLLDLSRKEAVAPVDILALKDGIKGELTADRPLDFLFKVAKCFRTIHTVALKANTTYQIDLTGSFDTYLRVEDYRRYVPLAYNDDISRSPVALDSRVVFTPERDDLYRLVVTSGVGGATGSYVLRVAETVPLGAPTVLRGKLHSGMKKDRDHYYTWHSVPLVADGPCTLTLQSSTFSTRVRLYDPDQKKSLGHGDYLSPFDGRFSRIDVTPPVGGAYQVYVSSSRPLQTGDYTLTVQQFAPVSPQDRK